MPRRNSTVEIKDGKVVFSKEVLEYFESIRTEENSAWIDKYFEYLSDEENLSAEKYNIHHIRPCFSFKDENHKNRKETLILGDEFNGNLIKLSVRNHLLAHHCLWKIFDNFDSKISFQRMCGGTNKYTKELSEKELKEISKLQEECAKKNKTEDELREYNKKYRKEWYENNRNEILKKNKIYRDEHKEEIMKISQEWYKNHKDKVQKRNKKYRQENSEQIKNIESEYRKTHKDVIRKKNKTYREGHKEELKQRDKEYYEKHKDEISEKGKIYRKLHDEEIKEKKKIDYEKNKDKISEKGKQLCFDPIKNKPCTLNALKCRKRRNKELYKDVTPTQCIIKNQ